MQHAANPALMKRHNLNAVMNQIRTGEVSRADLSRKLGLTRAAVTNLVDSLIERNLITERPSERFGVGRTPIILAPNPKAMYFGGIWLVRGTVHVCVADFCGRGISSVTFRQNVERSWQDKLDEIIASLESLFSRLGIPKDRVFAVGVGAPGPIDRENGMIMASPLFVKWDHAPIVSYIKEKTGLDAVLESDVGALAIAEKHLGAAREDSDYLQLFVETGIRTALVRGGKLYRGTEGFEGELGHTTVDINGEKCVCGRRGCLEMYASVYGLRIKAAKSLNRPEPIPYESIVDLARQNSAEAKALIEEEARYLSAGLANVVRMTGVSKIIVSGDLTYGADIFYPMLEKSFAEDKLYKMDISIRSSELGADAHLVAAVNIAIERFYETFC